MKTSSLHAWCLSVFKGWKYATLIYLGLGSSNCEVVCSLYVVRKACLLPCVEWGFPQLYLVHMGGIRFTTTPVPTNGSYMRHELP